MRRTASRRHGDRGVSVVEFTLAAVIGALLLAASTTALVGAMRTVRSVDASTTALGDARVAMEAMTRTLRVAYKPSTVPAAVVLAKPDRVRFYALLNRTGATTLTEPPATLVEYSYDGTCLNEAQTRGATTTTKCLVRTAVAPTFTYFTSGASAIGGAPVLPLPASPQVTTGNLPTIRSVQVALTVRRSGGAAGNGLPVITRVTFQNLAAAGG